MVVPETTTRRMGGVPYKWVVAIVIIFGLFMTILNSTIVNIAISRLQTAFGANLNSVQWVITGYTLAQGVVTPLTAYMADRFGTKRVYLVALAAFTIGSALCGLAWSLPVLIFFRVLQGLGGALLSPLAITLLYREFPPQERGLAMGVLGIPILLAPAFGPTLGGYIVTFASWPLIFYINVPIGIVGLIMGYLFLQEFYTERQSRFDFFGFLFSASGLAVLLYGLSSASTDGWGSATVIGCIAAGVLLLVLFVFVELRIAHNGGQPLLNLSVFSNGPFLSSNIASAFVTFALYGGLFVVPLYLQNLRGLSAYQAGLILLPQAFASMIAVVFGGRLVDRFGVRLVVIPGLLLMAFANWELSHLSLSIPYGSLQVILALRGFSIGLCMQPLMVSALSEIKPRMLSEASSLNTALRFVFSSLTVAVIATLLQTQATVHTAHLAERVTATSPFGQLIFELQGYFVSKGSNLANAYQMALTSVEGLLQQRGYLMAMQDTFLLSATLAGVAVIATFFVRSRRATAPDTAENILSEEERLEAEAAREEALLGV